MGAAPEPGDAADPARLAQAAAQVADGIDRVEAAVRALAARLRPLTRGLALWTALTGGLAAALWWSESGATAGWALAGLTGIGVLAWLLVPWSAQRAADTVRELAGAVRRAPAQIAPFLTEVRERSGALRFSGRALRGALQLRRLRTLRSLAEAARVSNVAALTSAPGRAVLSVVVGIGSLVLLLAAIVAGTASAIL